MNNSKSACIRNTIASPLSTPEGDVTKIQSLHIVQMGGKGEKSKKPEHVCCGQLFYSFNHYVAHLAKRASKNGHHETKLIDLGMTNCSLCPLWIHREKMLLHMKKAHGAHEVKKNAKESQALNNSPFKEAVIAGNPIKCGENYVIRIGGQPLRVSRPLNTIDVSKDGVVSKHPVKLTTTANEKHYPKTIKIQQVSGNSSGKLIVRQPLVNNALPVLAFGPRIIMKSCTIPVSSENGIPSNVTGAPKVISVSSNSILGSTVKSVTRMPKVQINESSVSETSRSNLLEMDSKCKAASGKLEVNLHKKAIIKRIKVIDKAMDINRKNKTNSNFSTDNSRNFAFVKTTAENGVSELENSERGKAANSSVKNIINRSKVNILNTMFSENTLEDHRNGIKKSRVGSAPKVISVKGKGSLKNKSNKNSCPGGNLSAKTKHKQQLKMSNKQQNSVSRPSTLFSLGKNSKSNGSEKITSQTRKKPRKQTLVPFSEPDAETFDMSSKENLKKKNNKKTSIEYDLMSDVDNVMKKNGKCLKPQQTVTPKTSCQSVRGGLGGFRKKRPVGRPRKERSNISEMLAEADSLSEMMDDIENDPLLLQKSRDDENIPTVELDLFTLPSLSEQVSVLLTDPGNPDLKVFASMDAIFVGDSALGDVTNQAGYVTDSNNVVFVSPSHFLFPNINELDKFVPSPIVTVKEKMNKSPRKLCKLSGRNKHSQVIFIDKQLAIENSENSCERSTTDTFKLGKQVSTTREKKVNRINNDWHTFSKDSLSPKSEASLVGQRIRRRSARLSGEPDDALHSSLVLKTFENKKSPLNVLTTEKAKIILDKESTVSNLSPRESILECKESNVKKLKILVSPLSAKFKDNLKKSSSGKSPANADSTHRINDRDTSEASQVGGREVEVDKKQISTSKKPRTRARSADCIHALENSDINNSVSADRSNSNRLPYRRTRQSKSLSGDIFDCHHIAKESDGSNISYSKEGIKTKLMRSRTRHLSDGHSLNPSFKISGAVGNDDVNKSSQLAATGKHLISAFDKKNAAISAVDDRKNTAVSERSVKGGTTDLVVGLRENSLLEGKNSTVIGSCFQGVNKLRPLRQRRPSAKWLESLAYDKRTRRVSSPRLRTVRSLSDTSEQSIFGDIDNILLETERTSALGIARIKDPSNESEKTPSSNVSTEENNAKVAISSAIVNENALNKDSDSEKMISNVGIVNNMKEDEANMDDSVTAEVIGDNVDNIVKCLDDVKDRVEEHDVSKESVGRVDNFMKHVTEREVDSIIDCSEVKANDNPLQKRNIHDSATKPLEKHSLMENISISEKSVNENSMVSPKDICPSNAVIAKTKRAAKYKKKSNKSRPRDKCSVYKHIGFLRNGKEKIVLNEDKNKDLSGSLESPIRDIKLVKNYNEEIHQTEEKVTSKQPLDTNAVDVDKSEHEQEFALSLENNCPVKEIMLEVGSLNKKLRVDHSAFNKPEEIENCSSGEKLEIEKIPSQLGDTKTLNKMPDSVMEIASKDYIQDTCKTIDSNETEHCRMEEDKQINNSHANTENIYDKISVDSIPLCINPKPSSPNKSETTGTTDLFDTSQMTSETESVIAKVNKIMSSVDVSTSSEWSMKEESCCGKTFTRSRSRVSSLLIAVNEAIKEENTDEKAIGSEGFTADIGDFSCAGNDTSSFERSSFSDASASGNKEPELKKYDLSPKSCPDESPRQWLGRGAKLKAQVLIQDQQTGVTDSHVFSSHSPIPFKGKINPPPKLRNSVNCGSDDITLNPKTKISQTETVSGPKSPDESSKVLKSPKSPRKVSLEEREWQARGAKLKAQIMITDQQTGQTNTKVESLPNVSPKYHFASPPPNKKAKQESPGSEWQARGAKLKAQILISDQQRGQTSTKYFASSPSNKKSKQESPGNNRDIRSYFVCKSREKISTKSSPEVSTSPCSSKKIDSSPGGSLNRTAPQSVLSPNFCSPESVSNTPKPSPSISNSIPEPSPNNRKRKLKLYTVTNTDIRNFFNPVSGSKRKVDSISLCDNTKSLKLEKENKSLKLEEEVSPGRVSDSSVKENVFTNPEQRNVKSSNNAQVLFRSKVPNLIPNIQNSLPNFEGFQFRSRRSGLRAKSLIRLVSLLEKKRCSGLSNFPFPLDQLCDWNDGILDIKVFDNRF
ncbi:hypothetical protein SK128_025342 [Halocaridina rubra]|uniref:Uncharacterized protein n=1 Tax=Halocaridina rubra TaxID=373956 RepID=A0AAN9AEG5_HALRR